MGRSYLDYPTSAVGVAAPAAATSQPMTGYVLPEVSERLGALDFTPVTGGNPGPPVSRYSAAGDPDGDTLDNAAEAAAGTDPWDSDTDDDLALDAVDAAPLDDQVQ